MSREKIKPKKLWFFATFFYSLLFWILFLLTLLSVVLTITTTQERMGSYIAILMFAIPMFGVAIIRKVRRKSLSLKLPIKSDDIPYTSDELKHYVGLQDNDVFAEEYYNMCNAYRKLKKSKMVQVILSDTKNTELRSAAKSIITTADTKFEMRNCPVLYLKHEVPILLGFDRKIYYLYPHFVLSIGGKKDITAFSYAEFGLSFSEGSYILGYDEKVPRDAEIIGKAYEYSNKDGSPDMRVKDNPSAPIIKTAEIVSDNFNINYQISDFNVAEEFFEAFEIFVGKAILAENIRTKVICPSINMSLEDKDVANEENNQNNSKDCTKYVSSIKNSYDDPQKELANLIGLDNVKSEIITLTNLVQVQQARIKEGLRNTTMSYHLVFTGNPGTGKTTIARIIASIYRDLGILKKGHLVETDRAGLVAGYLGQTAIKTNSVIDEALDGVLFIDEAYSLSEDQDSFGKEAIATLLKRMEDNRDKLVVILAGYTDEMRKFISTNSGLESRFNRYIEFPDYSEEELLKIFMKQIERFEYVIDNDSLEIVKNTIHENFISRDRQFGNARFVRNLFERILANQANRLASGSDISANKLCLIEKEDCSF